MIVFEQTPGGPNLWRRGVLSRSHLIRPEGRHSNSHHTSPDKSQYNQYDSAVGKSPIGIYGLLYFGDGIWFCWIHNDLY